MQIDQLKRRKFITLLGGEWFSELLYGPYCLSPAMVDTWRNPRRLMCCSPA
jgi:hypothetical protein